MTYTNASLNSSLYYTSAYTTARGIALKVYALRRDRILSGNGRHMPNT